MMNMFEKVQFILLAMISIVCVYLLFHAIALQDELDRSYKQVSMLSEKLTLQNNAIDHMVAAQKEKEAEIKQAQEDARKLRIQHDKDAKDVLNKKVSKHCAEAVKWGAVQGLVIYQGWAAGY